MAKLKKLKKPGNISYFRCPSCGERNEAGAEQCVGCGLTFRGMTEAGPQSPQKAQPQSEQPIEAKPTKAAQPNGFGKQDLEPVPSEPEIKVAIEKSIEEVDEKMKVPGKADGVNGFESIDIPLEPEHASEGHEVIPDQVISECPVCGAYSKGFVQRCPECGSVFEPLGDEGTSEGKGTPDEGAKKPEIGTTINELAEEMAKELAKKAVSTEPAKVPPKDFAAVVKGDESMHATQNAQMARAPSENELGALKEELRREFSEELEREFSRVLSRLSSDTNQMEMKLESSITKKMEGTLSTKLDKLLADRFKDLTKSSGDMLTPETKQALKAELAKELKAQLASAVTSTPSAIKEDELAERLESKLSSKLDAKLASIETRLGELKPDGKVDSKVLLDDMETIAKSMEEIQSSLEQRLHEHAAEQSRKLSDELDKLRAQQRAEITSLMQKAQELQEHKAKEASSADVDAWRKLYEARTSEVEREFKEKFDQLQKEYQERLDSVERDSQLEIEEAEAELKREFEDKLKEKEEELKSAFDLERKEMLQKFDYTLKAELRKKEDELLLRTLMDAKKREDELNSKLSALEMDVQKQVMTKVEEEIPKIKENTKRELEAIYLAREKELLANADDRIKGLEHEIRQKIDSENRLRLETVRIAALAVSKGLPNYPFTALVGQDRMKRALILNAINPGIGGVLLWGPKGNGKTTAILGLNALLGKLAGKSGDALTVEDIQKRFIVGEIMTYFVQGDYIIDTLSNSSALSISSADKPIVVREAVHEEESSMKLFNRIPFKIEVPPIQNIEQRIEVMRRVLDFKKAPDAFQKKYEGDERKLLSRVTKAREILSSVTLSTQMMENIARLCLFNNQGQKADIFIGELAKTNAAYEERDKVILDDIREVSDMVFTDKFDSVFSIDNLRPEKKFSLMPVPKSKGEQEVRFYIKAE